MARTLDVYLYQHHVGSLIQDDHGEMVFDYAATWLNNPIAIPLSYSLPLRKERYTRRECRGFFEGTLPEQLNRELAAKNLGISPRNDFAMLEKIGGECAGAVTFVPSGESLPQQNEGYHPLTEQALAELLTVTLPRHPLMAGVEGVRLSLAGAQNKIAVCITANRISLPLGGAISTHILKPGIAQYEGIVVNEALCMQLARAVGLPTAGTEIGHAGGVEYLQVERYDRVLSANRSLERLHQEDFCQALGIVSEHKYQSEGGPSLARCFQLVRDASSIPALDLVHLLDAVIFNFLIGNNDAHGKNFSLLYGRETGRQIRLAPLYDLLSTAYYSNLSPKMAMKIGSETVSDKVYPRDFERFAQEAGLSKPLVKRRVLALAAAIIATLPAVTPQHRVAVGVAKLIQSRCERTKQRFETNNI